MTSRDPSSPVSSDPSPGADAPDASRAVTNANIEPAGAGDSPHTAGDPPSTLVPAATGMTTETALEAATEPARSVTATIDGVRVTVAAGTSILDAHRATSQSADNTAEAVDGEAEIPTLCYGETITPKNACRVCMVEVEGARTLVPACSRAVEDEMVINTRTARVDHARKMVLEFLGSTVDLSLTEHVDAWNHTYGADPSRYGDDAATHAGEPVKVDNELFIRDYAKCILCYQCVDACGEQWQHSFVIEIAGRGFDSHISTEHDVTLPDSACVFCGNCIQVCPTGALLFKTEYDMRADGTWDPNQQTVTDTICAFCGVGCNLSLYVQDNTIVKVMSPPESEITHGNLCIKGRFGFQHAQNRPG